MTLHHTSTRIGATVLAALRFWQARALEGPTELPGVLGYEIATNDGELDPLTSEEVDRLCEELNCRGAVYLGDGLGVGEIVPIIRASRFGEDERLLIRAEVQPATPPAIEPAVYVVKGCDRYGPTMRWLAFPNRPAAEAQALAWVREMDTEGAGLAAEDWEGALRLLNLAQVADAMCIDVEAVTEADLESYREERESVSEVWIEEVPTALPPAAAILAYIDAEAAAWAKWQAPDGEDNETPQQEEADTVIEVLGEVRRFICGEREPTPAPKAVPQPTPAQLLTFTAFCQDKGGQGTTWIEAVEAKDAEEAGELAVQKCAEEWGRLDDLDPGEEPDLPHLLGLAEGDVKILLWEDEEA